MYRGCGSEGVVNGSSKIDDGGIAGGIRGFLGEAFIAGGYFFFFSISVSRLEETTARKSTGLLVQYFRPRVGLLATRPLLYIYLQ